MAAFEDLAVAVFHSMFKNRILNGIPGLIKFVKVLRAVFCNAIYEPEFLETILQGIFKNAKMADHSYATSIGTRTAFLAATAAAEPSLIMFTNYNGAGLSSARDGKFYPCTKSMHANSLGYEVYHGPDLEIGKM